MAEKNPPPPLCLVAEKKNNGVLPWDGSDEQPRGDLLRSPELEGSRREPFVPEAKRSPDLEVGVGHVDLPAERYSSPVLVPLRIRSRLL
ncbi:hypothetical protein L2E82_35738 [Cichorium intybus]|uniref:Uncharacterized protein n=1 Tax=Cichorium intybus TaxID=13427 RepID=A0ACB9BPS0_CICIN|nr:hypothetical protein L2E82_35738 [Cichorium intybus]